MDCPEIRDLAAFAETGQGTEPFRRHIAGCDACQESLRMVEEEVLSLQIPLTEIWFREHISCVHTDVLAAYRRGGLDPERRDYVKFHVEDLECAWCQGRLGEVEVAESKEGRRGVTRSRKRVGDAASALRSELRKAKA